MSLYNKKIHLPNTEYVGDSIITLPTHPNLKQTDLDKIIKIINKFNNQNLIFSIARMPLIISAKFSVSKDDDASGPFDCFNFTCFSMRILLELFYFFKLANSIGAVMPIV